MATLNLLFFILFAGFILLNCCFYVFFGKFWLSKPSATSLNFDTQKGVSVLCSIKNEAAHLGKLLNSLKNQDYPCYEVILVNDHSTDESLEILKEFSSTNQAFRFIDLKKVSGKKAALTQAIAQAQHPFLLVTDADCIPASTNWIQRMRAHFTDKKEIVLGYGGYIPVPHSVLNKLVRFETLFTALQYFAYAHAGNAYMGVGRNLAYTKALFTTGNGFTRHLDAAAGDDDLFVNEHATPENTSCCLDPKAFTYSIPKTTWSSWFVQKRRHIGVSHRYQTRHKMALGLFYCSQLFTYLLLPVILIFNSAFLEVVLLLFGIREVLVFIVLSKAATRLREHSLIYYTLILEPFMISMQMLIFISTIVVKPRRWN